MSNNRDEVADFDDGIGILLIVSLANVDSGISASATSVVSVLAISDSSDSSTSADLQTTV